VAKKRGFSRAAVDPHVAQREVSHQVKAVENARGDLTVGSSIGGRLRDVSVTPWRRVGSPLV
jgi:hypothetical protein